MFFCRNGDFLTETATFPGYNEDNKTQEGQKNVCYEYHQGKLPGNFRDEVLNSDKPVLLDFWAPWCTYCRRISFAYDQVAEQNKDILVTAKVNIDEEPRLAGQEKIQVIPTLVLYHEGKVIASITTPESKAKIDAFLREHLPANG